MACFDVAEVSLDHDISHYIKDTCCINPHLICCVDDFKAVAWFIANMNEEKRPKKVTIHTANPWGAREIYAILDSKVRLDIKPSKNLNVGDIEPKELHLYKQDIRWKAVLEMQKREETKCSERHL